LVAKLMFFSVMDVFCWENQKNTHYFVALCGVFAQRVEK